MEKFMDKDKQRKSKNNEEEQKKDQQDSSPSKEENSAEEKQTMVALTFDEYDALEKEIENLQEQIEENKDGWLRTRADFDNYKKRVQRDAARSYQDSMTSIVKVFLSAVDDLERALKNEPQGKDLDSWVNGIELIHQKLITQMKNLGVEPLEVNPGDEFDPNIHEAITQEEHEEFKEGQIIDVVQQGYRISDRIIRPAMVRVAR
ncbi:MAG TPA: nucleotide exchange factor GrpE [Anaerolineaceae bacterium]|jgi:molecular chaperone GrpE|nr:nucleotide exchange factor GrpE [Anaerolineaceae bacterium]